MKLATLLRPDLVFLDVEGENRRSVYKEIVSRMELKLELNETVDSIVDGLIEREDTTQLPYELNLAFPHLRLSSFNDLHISVTVLKKPVKLKENDWSDTQIILTFLISFDTSETYLMVLAAFTRYLLNQINRKHLIEAESADGLISMLDEDNVEIRHTLTAEDIMKKKYPFVKKDDHLGTALDIFTREKCLVLPVIDNGNILAGVISARAVVLKSIPEYILMLDNTKFLTSFEPFKKLLDDEQDISVADYTYPSELTITPETPLIQFTLLLVKGVASDIFVVKEGKLLGVITMQEIINNVLRG